MPYNRKTGEYYEPKKRYGSSRYRPARTPVRKSSSYKNNGGKSGCRLIESNKNEKPCIVAWNKSKRRGLVTIVAVPCNDFTIPKKNKLTGKEQNSKCDKWVAKVKTNFGALTQTCFYNPVTKKLTFPDMEMVANPNTNYFGTYKQF
nr:hypothetical protein [uncultured Draconibacterium sp.]